ncbi:type VII secretion protein EccCa [Arthrobacter sp. zg-Y1219]|uniref:type VII secretion protein EccCa n=1 Tax=Arthrobacter sp. zg-Y1219 TaxID=3049067 RepID=UPI0024C3798F|nr:type VII secretion protein EccCa [Arthrobacter sp. zg-Y1219]MDK1360241.1 type VII secretion protein EccCa [Arthrobacter sp. zg-Y1219]
MSTRILHRPARTTAPARTIEAFSLDAPPPIEGGRTGMNMMSLVPLLGAGVSMTVMMLFRGSPLAAVGALMMVVTIIASVIMMLSQRGRQGKQRREQRENYLEYLERSRAELRADEQAALAVARAASPPPNALFDILRDTRRIWERRRANEDFLHVRIGTGFRRNREVTIMSAGSALAQTDTFMTTELEILKRRYESSPELPLTVPLDCAGNVSVVGSRRFVAAVARLLLIEGAAFHSPEDLHLALVLPEERRNDWEWATWLPHLADQKSTHATGPVRRLAATADALAEVLAEDLHHRSSLAAESRKNFLRGGVGTALPRLLVVNDSYGVLPAELQLPDQQASAASLGITTVFLVADRQQEPGEVVVRISEDSGGPDGTFILENYRGDPVTPVVERGSLDILPVPLAEALARELAPLRLSPDSLEHDTAETAQGFLEMLGLSADLDAADIRRLWKPRGEVDFLRVPLGPDDRGRPALLDLKESAQFGHGPHGLCVGATGSGKSEMLRSMVVGLLATHSPEVLAMVLVDYKGGATFAPFAGAPQVAGVITNLSDDVSLIERVYASLSGEIQRRQEVLKAAGNLANITDYQLHRQELKAQGIELAPLPHLVVIIDEFGELLTARPDFIELFLSIGRIGRSIGVHLLLSSQRIEGGKLRGLDTYLSYRIGLRTLSEAESRTVLDTPDAFHLPPVPGFGYLKVDTTTYTRFKAGYVSGPLEAARHDGGPAEADDQPQVLQVPRYAASLSAAPGTGGAGTGAAGAAAAPSSTSSSKRTTGPTVLSTLMDTLATFPRAVDPIWLPPLPRGIALDRAAGGLSGEKGLRLASGGSLRVPVGLLDDPAKQWQGLWELDLAANGGNAAIVGGPQTGKSTALRTIVASLSLTHSPAEMGIYAIDLLSSSLVPLEGLPHVGGVAVRTNREVVRRTVDELLAMLAHREHVFEKHQVDSLPTLRRRCAEGDIPELPSADIVLVLDGYGQLSDEFEEIEKPVHALISRGAGYGIHVIVTCSRMNEIRISQQSFFGNRIELRLADPGESAHGRKLAEAVSTGSPGRSLTDRKLQGHFALPRLDSDPDDGSATQGLRELVAAVAASTRERAMQVRVLPGLVSAETALTPDAPAAVPLGLRETDLGTETLDLHSRERHLLIMGDDGSGKTNVMRSVVRRLIAQHRPEDIVFAVFDPRRSLTGEVPTESLGGYATSAALADQLAAAVAGELEKRTTAAPAELAGLPRIVLVIDDYDVLTAGGSSPLSRLTPFLPLAPEFGLHAVLSRRVRGASRGMYEPFFTALRDSGSAALILSGDRGEGTLINGVRARTLPPGRAQLIQPGKPVQVLQLFFNDDESRILSGTG